jgi:RIO-like serine/threonine protein kinase
MFQKRVSAAEHELYVKAASLCDRVPPVCSWDGEVLSTVRIGQMCLADMYGAADEKLPAKLWNEVRAIVKTLFDGGLYYYDITGYNFIEDTGGKVWIVDFEHAKAADSPDAKNHNYLLRFLTGKNGWNKYFE